LYRYNDIRTYSYQDSDFNSGKAIIKYAFDGYTKAQQQISFAKAKWEYKEAGAREWTTLLEEDIEPTPSGEFYEFNISTIITKVGKYNIKLSV
jgi:hypothetical protein